MPCRGPCCKTESGRKHQDFGDVHDPACVFDSGHDGPCSWAREELATRMDRQISFQAAQMAAQTVRGKFTIKQILCSACRSLERLNYDFDENPALSRWWHEHRQEDGKG